MYTYEFVHIYYDITIITSAESEEEARITLAEIMSPEQVNHLRLASSGPEDEDDEEYEDWDDDNYRDFDDDDDHFEKY